LSSSIVKRLTEIVGEENAITDPLTLMAYSFDASENGEAPSIVVRPGSTEEVAKVMQAANASGTPVIPRGGGTSLAGAALPLKGSIVLDMTRMNRVIEVSRENLTALVEAGLKLKSLNDSLGEGLFFPIDIGSPEAATIGGMIATNASGIHSPMYGSTGDRVLGLEVVLPSGEVVQVGSRTYKTVSGLDLKRIFIGSEGTLGVITKAFIKLAKKPSRYVLLVGFFESDSDAARAASKIIASGLRFSAMEFMDKDTVEVASANGPAKSPDTGAALFVEFIGETEEGDAAREAENAMVECRAKRVIVASGEKADNLWKVRTSVYEAISRIYPPFMQLDPSIPVSRIPEFLSALRRISRMHRINILVYGHIGEGVLHPTIIADKRDQKEIMRARAAVREILKEALKLGGSLTGEHGIGALKSKYVKMEFTPYELEFMKKLKQILDPKGILNPGKLV